MKKSNKGSTVAQARSIRTLSRKENAPEIKRNQVNEQHTYQNINNTSGLFPSNVSQHDRSSS